MTLLQLARKAGMWVETVQLFVQRNMTPGSGEDDSFDARDLEVVRFIGRIQAEHQLSLDTIAQVLVEECDFDLNAAERSLVALAEPDPKRAGPGPASRQTLISRTGVHNQLVDVLVDANVLPAHGPYSGHHVWIVSAVQELVEHGVALETALRMGKTGLAIAETEVDAVIADMGQGSEPMAAMDSSEERRAAVSRLVSAVRLHATGQLMARLARVSNTSQKLAIESVHVPSRLFMARHDMESSLNSHRDAAQLVLSAENDLAYTDNSAVCEYGRLLLGLGQFAEATRVLASGTEHPAGQLDGTLWSFLALAYAMEGDDHAATNAVERAVQVSPECPRVHAFKAAVLGIQAGRAADLLLATARIQEGLQAVEVSRSLESTCVSTELEARITRGRLCTVLPSAFGVTEHGLEDLRWVLTHTESVSDEELGFSVAGSRDLMRINALFFLGVALLDAGEKADGTQLLNELLTLDPASEYGRVAYARIHGN